jgi:acetyl-CoA carboxylase carboxyltransferase component
MEKVTNQLEQIRKVASSGGGEARMATQHAKNKLTARS